MLDSTAAHGLGIDPSKPSRVNGNRAGAERAPRSTIHGFQDLEGSGAEHVSALLKMGALKQEAGDYPEAEDLFRRAVELGERVVGPENPALVTALMKLAGAHILCGSAEAAEPLVIRALSLTENGVGENDQDHVILVNDLARLCLKQSAHAIAEPLLLRLLAMKRSKGDDHPEVATVLASLAAVRQALGRHESAEQLWRRVLDIRERTLAPNHFGLATALERLADSCSARGKIVEALALLQRALTIRELTLDPGNPSLRASRDRIADLQLQASEESLDLAAQQSPPSIPERYRLLSADHSVQSASPIQERRPATVRVEKAPTGERKVAAVTPLIEVPQAKEEIGLPMPLFREQDVSHGSVPQPEVADHVFPEDFEQSEPGLVDYQDVILSIQQELEEDEPLSPMAADRLKNMLAPMVEVLRQRQKEIAVTVGAVALVAGLATVSQALIKSQQAGPAAAITAPGTDQSTSLSVTQSVGRPLSVVADRAEAPAVASAAAIPVAPSSRVRVADQRVPARRGTDRRETAISIPTLSSTMMAGFDSIVRARTPAPRSVSEPVEPAPSPPPVIAAPASRASFAPEPQIVPPQRARLIGKLPAPHYPEQLIDVQGDVRVRFEVDAAGRPVMSSLAVLSSSNEFFTAAVFKVIPGLRFEPALSGGTDSKPTGDVVQLGFAFRPSK